MTFAIEARNSAKNFGQGEHVVRAHDDVSSNNRNGEFFTLLGPSGSGKTAVLRMIAGFESRTSGQMWLMSAGKIRQIGASRDIYTRPVNRLVASFLGETNFLPAHAANDRVTLKAGGVIDAMGADGRVGDITVTVRPEQVRIASPPVSGAAPATIRDLIYLGTDVDSCVTSGDIGLRAGAEAGIHFAAGALQVLGDRHGEP